MNFFKVPQSSIPFLRGLVIQNKSLAILTSMAMARVLSQNANLPPQEIPNPRIFFLDNIGLKACSYLDSILDVIPINHKLTMEYAKKFYSSRYEVSFGPAVPPVTGSNGIYNLFHIGVYFSKEELEILKESGDDFSNLVAGFEAIFKAMDTTKNIML